MLRHLAPFYVGLTKFHLNLFGKNLCPKEKARDHIERKIEAKRQNLGTFYFLH
jgi:hypothetical protein